MTIAKALRPVVVAACLWAVAFTHSLAMTVTPLHVEMVAIGSASRSLVSVTNESAIPLPVEIMLNRLVLGENGERRLTPAGEDFLVFPGQALIAPGSTQSFRLQWVGDPAIEESRSYLVSVNQIPVKLPRSRAGVQVVVSFGVQVNVAPMNAVPALVLVGTGTEVDRQTGRRRPTITVQNTSRMHALLPQGSISLSSGAWSRHLDQSFLGEKVGIGLVQPGKRRRFVLPVDLPTNVSQIQAALDFRPRR